MTEEHIMKEAKKMFSTNYSKILTSSGTLPPSKNTSPLNPPWSSTEYEAMEKDTAKYFLYYAAIQMALKSLTYNFSSTFNCMVVGAGRGRLVDYCLDCFKEQKIDGQIFVVEANEEANKFLRDKFLFEKSVVVLSPIVIRSEDELSLAIKSNLCDANVNTLVRSKSIDLFISELFGSFGDNEFVVEILSACKTLFGNQQSISIPDCYTTYVCAIHSPTLRKYFELHSSLGMYILGLPNDTSVLSELVPVYSSSCTEKQAVLTAMVELELHDATPLKNVTGFAGYFKAKLFGDIFIDSTPGKNRNTYFWESAFFPLQGINSTSSIEVDKLSLKLSRNCKTSTPSHENIFNIKFPLLRLLYEWVLTDDKMSPLESSFHKIDKCSRSNVNSHELHL